MIINSSANNEFNLARYQAQLDNACCKSSASLTIRKAELCRQAFPTRR
jgi:hypothetical protein